MLQQLEDAHLVAWSPRRAERVQFGAILTHFLLGMRETEVLPIHGHAVTDLEGLCHQAERLIPGPRIERRIDGPRGLTTLLRERPSFPGRPASKYRFYIWHDADVLLAADQSLFGRAIDAMAGVAAESEYVSDDLLLVHRAVVIGSETLAEYAKDEESQFHTWHDDGLGDPFWEVVTGVPLPPIEVATIESLTG